MFSPFCQTCPGGNGPFPGQPKKKKKVCPFQAPKTTKNGPSWRSAESCTVLQSTNRGYGGWVTKKGDAESRCARYLDNWSYHVFIAWSNFSSKRNFRWRCFEGICVVILERVFRLATQISYFTCNMFFPMISFHKTNISLKLLEVKILVRIYRILGQEEG